MNWTLVLQCGCGTSTWTCTSRTWPWTQLSHGHFSINQLGESTMTRISNLQWNTSRIGEYQDTMPLHYLKMRTRIDSHYSDHGMSVCAARVANEEHSLIIWTDKGISSTVVGRLRCCAMVASYRIQTTIGQTKTTVKRLECSGMIVSFRVQTIINQPASQGYMRMEMRYSTVKLCFHSISSLIVSRRRCQHRWTGNLSYGVTVSRAALHT